VNWDDIKIFLAVAKTGGLKKAAREIGIHHSSCSRRINALENDLAIKLFDRLPAGYTLTQSGLELLKSAEQIQQEFNNIDRDLLGKDLRIEGDLCLSLTYGFATHLLMLDLNEFMALYPGINLKINMTYQNQDLASLEADVAIRHVNNPPDSLAGKRVARVYWSAYASTKYLTEHDLSNHPEACHWLGWGDKNNHLNWAEKANHPNIPVRSNMFSDVLQLSGIQAHMGIASLPCYLADKVPGIQRIPQGQAVAREWIWVLAHKDMVKNARVKVLIDFLAQAFSKHKNKLSGVL